MKRLLILLIIVMAAAVSVAQVTMIDDPLINGSDYGTAAGGNFTSEGYMPVTKSGHLFIQLPAPVSEGYAEFEVKGMDHSLVPADADHAFFCMYDGRGISEPIRYTYDYKNNFFRWNVHWRQNRSSMKAVINCAEPVPERLNAAKAVYSSTDSRDWTSEPTGSGVSWDPDEWYTIRVEWKDRKFTVKVNGSLKWSTAGPYDYAPKVHRMWLGCAPNNGDKYANHIPRIVYRNLKVVSTGGGVEPPELSSITVTGTGVQVLTGASMQFAAAAYDQFGTQLNPQPSFTWSASGSGTVNGAGLYTAGGSEATGTITAAAEGIEGSATVSVVTEITAATVTLIRYHGTANAPELVSGGFIDGAKQCNDRVPAPAWTGIPAELTGLTYLLNARDDKRATGTVYTVGFDAPCLVYALIDDDAGIPAWIGTENWESANLSLYGSGQPYSVYRKEFAAGSHSLGVQENTSSEGTGYVFNDAGSTSLQDNEPELLPAENQNGSYMNMVPRGLEIFTANGHSVSGTTPLTPGIYLVNKDNCLTRLIITK